MYWSVSTLRELIVPPRFQYVTAVNPITYIDCSFTLMTEEPADPAHQFRSGGSAIRLFSQAPLSITNCTFSDCKTQLGDGGAILIASRDYEVSTTLTIEGSRFVECTCAMDGGAIAITTSGSHSITRSSFTSCHARYGGGACVCTCAFSFSEFVSNTALMECGGLDATSAASLLYCHFEGNSAQLTLDWSINAPLTSVSTAFGCTQSRDSEVTDDVMFVVSGAEGGDCSFSSPCDSLSAALQKVGKNEWKEIKLGTGSFGEVHIMPSSCPTICGYYRKEDWDSTQTSSSFSLILDTSGAVTLTDLDLVPLTGAPIVKSTADASLYMYNLRMAGVDGISLAPFVFSAGTATFSFCHFDSLSSMECSLISISDAAFVDIQNSLFHQIESSSSVVSVVDGRLTLNYVIFRHLTRTSGLGGAALDCDNAASLTIRAQFSSCHSKTGLCGAIHLNVTDQSTIHSFHALFYLNRGRDGSDAHDIHLSTITVDDFSKFDGFLSSISLSPQIVDDNGGISSLQPLSSLYVFDGSDIFNQIGCYEESLTQSDVEALDLSAIIGETGDVNLTLYTKRGEMTSIRPVECSGGSIKIQSSKYSLSSPLTQSSKTDGTLFSMRSSSYLTVSFCILILTTKQTDPMITIDSTSTLQLSNSIISSDGGLSNRAFCQSEGSITISNASIVSMTFSTHSCIETTGGSLTIMVGSSHILSCVTNLSTSGNGALVNAKDTYVSIGGIPMTDCHAANGGAIFVQNCAVYINYCSFFRCSAIHKGGAVCVENQNDQTQSVQVSFQQIVDCSADFGGGLYICNEGATYVSIGGSYWMIFMTSFSYPAVSGCRARKGSGAYIDGNFTTSQFLFSAQKYFNNSFAEGSDLFFSKRFADTHPNMTELLSNLCTNIFSLSGRSFDDDGQYRHIEVEGFPQLSRNFPPPTMEVSESDSPSEPPTMPGPQLYFNSLSYYLPYIHTQTDTGEYLPIPINLMSTLFFFETGTVTRQAIVLMMSKNEWNPVETVEVQHGQGLIESGIPFVEVADEGSMEFSMTKFEWTIDNHLCRLVSRSAHSSITGCEFTIQLSMSTPLVECESGTLIITSSSFSMQALVTDIFHPIVFSSSSSSHASNGKSRIEIEMSDVSFHDVTVQAGAAGVVVLGDADRIRLDRVRFVTVLNTEGQNGTRIVVRGRNLANVIEYVPNSEFPSRGGDEDDLYESLDEDEAVGSPFHSPTLLLYLSFFSAQSVFVHSIGREEMWCGDVTFPCASLDEADLHLSSDLLCTITVVDVAQLKGEVDPRQDKTEIVSKGGDKSRVDVWESGRLVNEAANLAHSLHLDSLAFSLSSDRSVALLESRSGMLTVTSCSFSSSSPLHSKLLEVTGGSVKISDVDISSVAFSDTLLSFSQFSNVNVSSLAHRECSAGTLLSFEGNGKSASRVELQNCAFEGKNEKSPQNDNSLCFWTSSLIEIVSCSFESSLSTYSHLSQGGLHVVSSAVKMIGGESVGNNALSTAFPSLQRNVLCEKESLIELGTDPLKTSSLWISTDSECVVKRNNGSVVSNTFFIPTLTVKSCSSLFDKKTETFRLELNGTLLIPCGLTLVVSENTSSSNTEPVRISLSTERTTEWTETSLRMEVKLSEFEGLGEKREWVGHVEFGETGRTEAFSLKLSSKQAQSLAMQKTLPWLIPLIVSLVALVLLVLLLWICCRRRKATHLKEKAEMQEQDALPVEDEKLEILDPTNENAQAQSLIDSMTAASMKNSSHENDGTMSSVPSQASLVEALVCGHKLDLSIVREQDTLYNALHVEKSLMAPKCVVRRQLALGLMKVAQANRSVDILKKLSSHWVMFDGHGNVCLKTEEPKQTIAQAAVDANGVEVEVSASKDGQRWKAPEVAKAEEEKDIGRVVDGSKASVFSLSLILWEIETGLVPFGELDAINAQRQIGTGILPKMDGIHENMVDVISSCLQLNPDDRPTLSTVWSVLSTLSDSGETAGDNEQMETH
ncbi:hypothetical protein BLNAU_4342 [Blattamonas nauphoetae]|uniref:Protein kinase domain-containing protein n=1 Tax=Blattamonas nauphoetae TaxID=2049346 RepID=A0ABQ9YA97_9EUKA|nr:hypothetical protein BLNAU_4342 [Blattamonas nauphoetae]